MAKRIVYAVNASEAEIESAKRVMADYPIESLSLITDRPAVFDAPTTPIIALNPSNRVALNRYFRTVKAEFADCVEFYTTHAAGMFGEATGIANLKIYPLSGEAPATAAAAEKPKKKKKMEVEDAGNTSNGIE
jgi:hypothetical protein